MAEQNPFPPMDAAPYWRPIAPEELGLILNDPPEPGDLDLAEGWELALFSIHQVDGRRTTVWGWVKGVFGVFLASMEVGCLGSVTHIPTGMRVGLFLDDAEAAFAADTILPITDWGAITPSSAHHIGPDLSAALLSAGFRRRMLFSVCVEETQTVWARDDGATH